MLVYQRVSDLMEYSSGSVWLAVLEGQGPKFTSFAGYKRCSQVTALKLHAATSHLTNHSIFLLFFCHSFVLRRFDQKMGREDNLTLDIQVRRMLCCQDFTF